MMQFTLDMFYIWLGAVMFPRWAFLAPGSRRYRAGLRQRLGFVPRMKRSGCRLWVHCASVGEASVPLRLMQRLKTEYPGIDAVFSSCTDTGVRRLSELYPDSPVFFMPCDLSACVSIALKRIDPTVLILVEQELWPNLLLACRHRHVPVAVVNGRINERSSRLIRSMFRLLPDARDAVRLCCVRSEMDAERFIYAGIAAGKVVNTGSLKYDAMETQAGFEQAGMLKEMLGIEPGDRVVVGGSTHEGEEEALARAADRLRHAGVRLRLIVAPRHVERTAGIAASLRKNGFDVETLTGLEKGGVRARRDSVILIDAIGRLVACYGLADAAFVGRSLFPPGGGQNIMEPAALGKPVLTGPHTGNFKPEMEMLKAGGAVKVVRDEAELEGALRKLLEDEEYAVRLGKRAREAIAANKGATGAAFEELRRLINTMEAAKTARP